MTAFDYARTKATADRLIARFGQSGTLRRPVTTGDDYDPTEGTPTDYAVTFVVEDYKNDEIDGTRILKTDKKVLLARKALSVEPTTSDLIAVGGIFHAIIHVKPLSPGGTVLTWEVQVRR